MKQIYLDNAATTSVRKEVFEAMKPYFGEKYGNPSSIHTLGQEAHKAVEGAREKVAGFLGCLPEEIYFTGSTTEADNLAIVGVLQASFGFSIRLPALGGDPHSNGTDSSSSSKSRWPSGCIEKPHLVISPLEHHAVLDTAKNLEKNGLVALTILPVDKYGLVDSGEVRKVIEPNTILVSVTYASNEVGTVQPIKEIGNVLSSLFPPRCHSREGGNPRGKLQRESNRNSSCFAGSPIKSGMTPYFHTDAAAAAEYLDLNVKKLGVDLMVVGPHKFGGPKGVGILYVRKGVKMSPLLFGGSQEKGLRPGTENVPAIIGAAKALDLAQSDREVVGERVQKLSVMLSKGVLSKVSGCSLTGAPFVIPAKAGIQSRWIPDQVGDDIWHKDEKGRVPHIVSFIFEGAEGEAMVLKLSDLGIMASSGSACTSGSLEPSHVLLAMGIAPERAHGSLRFSLGRETTEKDVDYVLKVLPEVVGELRKMNPLYK